MCIIGWDDSFDKDGDGIADGVWIIQNSWDDENYQYYYLAYTSVVHGLEGVKKIEIKNWDNNYDLSVAPKIECSGITIAQENKEYKVFDKVDDYNNSLMNRNAILGTVKVTYDKPLCRTEKLKMINFSSASQNSSYKVYISPTGKEEDFSYIKEVKTDMPGLYTVDFEDILLEGDKFAIKIETTDGAVYTQVNAFTTTVSIIENENDIESHIEKGGFNVDKNYTYKVISNVQNIEDGEKISYYLHDSSGNEILNEYNKNITINKGKAINTISFPRSTKIETELYIDIIYGEEIIETLKIVYNPDEYLGNMEGKGTPENPFIITTEQQLKLISNSPSANYKLGNDIDLTYDKNNENTFNYGMGWIPLESFCGTLDGNGYSIKNMYIYSEIGDRYVSGDEKYIGLFSILENATIKNLKIENANIDDGSDYKESYIGILAGKSIDSQINNVLISGNINAFNGKSKGIGLLVGMIENNNITELSKICCIGKIEEKFNTYVGSIIGYSKYDINLSDSLIITTIETPSNSKGYVGGVLGFGNLSSISDSYIFSTLTFNGGRGLDDIRENIDILNGSYEYYPILNINNIMTLNETNSYINSIINYQNKDNSNIKLYDSIEDFKNQSLEILNLDEGKWEYFKNNHYPTLKGLEFEFVKDIIIEESMLITVGEKRKIDIQINPENVIYREIDYLRPRNEFGNLKDNFIEIDGNGIITGKNKGTTSVIVKTLDGSNITKEITVTVVGADSNTEYEIQLYDCIEDKKLIDNILPTTIEHYKENIAIEAPYTAKVFKGEEEITEGNIATGMITRIYLEDNAVGEYTNVVPGDLDGDGIIRSRDCSMLKQYLIGLRDNMYETPAYYAADFTRDGKVKLNDAEYIQQYVVKMFELKEEEYYGKNN